MRRMKRELSPLANVLLAILVHVCGPNTLMRQLHQVNELGGCLRRNSSVSSAARDTLVVIITTEMYNYQFSDGPPTTPLTPTALWKAVSETSLNSSTALSRAIDVELTYLNATIIYHKVSA